MPPALSSPFHLLCCHPGGEALLQQELSSRHGIYSRIITHGMVQPETAQLPEAPLIFEWQRCPATRFIRLNPGEPLPDILCDAVWNFFAAEPVPWAVHLIPVDDPEAGGASRLEGIARELLRKGARLHPGLKKWERKPAKLIRNGNGIILQWACTSTGLLFSAAPPSHLSSAAPGGRCRMKMDPRAPSRSYLKIEEAFARMGVEPEAEQSVIDLGAAPGGWSFAFAVRGCQVTAVDNGPLKIQDACVRRIEHLPRDGLSFQLGKLQPPVDWLVGDMLIPPGKALGLLRYWVDGKHCRRVVMNLKLPQVEPLPALEPVLEWMRRHPDLQIRQLYHDRREVTVFGGVSS